jgi:hypothetical protein
VGAATARAGSYEHVPPWAPALITDDTLDLAGEPDVDPDAIDWDGLADAGDGGPLPA